MQAVSIESGISWSDMARMQTQHRSAAVTRQIDYTWAFNDKKVQQVVAAKIALIATARAIPDSLEKLKALDAVAISKMSLSRSDQNRKMATAAARVGGLAPYFVSLIYRGLRLGEDSCELAQENQVTPWGVRQTLFRLNQTAMKLADGTFQLRKPGRFPRRSGKHGPLCKWNFQAAIPLRKAGL